MKPNYDNWIPKWTVRLGLVLTFLFLALFFVFGVHGFLTSSTLKIVLRTASFVLFLVFSVLTFWVVLLRNAFSYDGKRKLAKEMVDFIADHVTVKEGGVGLDVGCGSGALTIAVAKRNRRARIIGLDRWGVEYSNFSRKLCEDNAFAEEVRNTEFVKGDAVKLDYPDESFDAVFSNYVYHNIKWISRQDLLMETLRVLKKGGTFAIHDIMNWWVYGDMEAFVRKLKDLGYEKVELIDTTDGKVMSRKEATRLLLLGSKLLCGVK